MYGKLRNLKKLFYCIIINATSALLGARQPDQLQQSYQTALFVEKRHRATLLNNKQPNNSQPIEQFINNW